LLLYFRSVQSAYFKGAPYAYLQSFASIGLLVDGRGHSKRGCVRAGRDQMHGGVKNGVPVRRP